MAQTTIQGGFVIKGDVAEATASDDEPQSVYDELLLKAMSNLRQGNPKAALSQTAECTNLIAQNHGLNGGAWT